jgi:hypothetical protein
MSEGGLRAHQVPFHDLARSENVSRWGDRIGNAREPAVGQGRMAAVLAEFAHGPAAASSPRSKESAPRPRLAVSLSLSCPKAGDDERGTKVLETEH